MTARDVVIIGAGHNGLVTACYLARAGIKSVVLERRDVIGGTAATGAAEEGFRFTTLAHDTGPFSARIARELGLEKRGLSWITPNVRTFAPAGNGPPIILYRNVERTAASIGFFSPADARSYPEFVGAFERLGRMLRALVETIPPDIDHPSAGDLMSLLGLARGFRSLPKRDAYRLLRWSPMAVADLAAEWFANDTLRAVVAARGIFGAFAGPWSAGTSLPLLLQAAFGGDALWQSCFVRGGIGSLTRVLGEAAQSLGVQIRTEADVARILVREGRATGVVLTNGEEIEARAVVSSADPRRTFLRLLDPADLAPSFLTKARNYRCNGTLAKVNLALSALPSFSAVRDSGLPETEALAGHIQIGPEIDYLERAFDAAKYGEFSQQPYLDITIPSITEPSLAPPGAHVMSICAQFAPYKLRSGNWGARREKLGDVVIKTLAEHAPNVASLIVKRQVLTPSDLEEQFALSGGHLLHGEMAADQLFAFRPILGWARYRTPVEGLFLCGAGTHPGGGLTGLPGRNASRVIAKDVKRAGRRAPTAGAH